MTNEMNKEVRSESQKLTLKELVSCSETAHAVALNLAARERFTQEINLDSLKIQLIREGFKIIDIDYNVTFEAIQELGYGNLVHSRKKGESAVFKLHKRFDDIGVVAGLNVDEVNKRKEALKARYKEMREKYQADPKPAAKKEKKASKSFDRAAYMRKRWAERKSKVTPIKRKPGRPAKEASLKLNASEAKALTMLLKKFSKSA